MDNQKLAQFVEENKLPKFRLGQLQKAIFQDGVSSFAQISTLPKDLREKMAQNLKLLSFEAVQILVAQNKDSIKALLKLADGNLIETVLISPKPGTWSACISCQVGCQMGCRFCATGKMGFVRNLTSEEITDQILFWRQYLNENFKFQILNFKLTNVVYMGMGEPFNNWENVAQSIRDLTAEKLFGFGSRSISVSTSGITAGIAKLAQEFPQVNLALSLHFSNDEKRSSFMPVNKKDDMGALGTALRNYFAATKRKVFIEYVLLDSINDGKDDAVELADYLKSIGHPQLLHVNLIRYNATPGAFKSVSRVGAEEFKNNLKKLGINATIRKSLGEEIKGACGQLAAH